MKINSKLFPFSFFLSHRINVNSLEEGAKKYGGATKNIETGEIWSNVHKNEFIYIQPKNNKVSVFIPSTNNINQENKELQKQVTSYIIKNLQAFYPNKNISFERALGSWYSHELNNVVYDNIIIASVTVDALTERDIRLFIRLAKYIKKEMFQESVTVTINNSLGLV